MADTSERNRQIRQSDSGKTLSAIALEFGLSRTRVYEILNAREIHAIYRLEGDPLFELWQDGLLITRTCHALIRNGYGVKFDFEQLKDKLTHGELSAMPGLGAKGIEQLAQAVGVRQGTESK